MKNEYQNDGFKNVTTEDLISRVEFLKSMSIPLQNHYDYLFKEWGNEIAYRLYAKR